ncbi:dihydrolipoamide acetyltransferase family protein [Streptomyces sp. NPDC058171]
MTTMTQVSVREFRMPDVGEGLTEAEILTWYVKVGDTVTDGQVVCEVETAKAAVELPIPYDGVVAELRHPAGTTVDVGEVIITVDVGGGTAPAPAPTPAPASAPVEADAPAPATAGASETAETTGGAGGAGAEEPRGRQPVLVGYGVAESSTRRRPRKGEPAPVAEPPAAPAPAASATAPAAPPAEPAGPAANGARPLAKPPVRKLAKDLGVDLAGVTPTGPGGIVTREDVHAAATPEPRPAATPAVPAATTTAPETAASETTAPVTGRETRIPVKGVRKATAQAMVASAFTAPHVTEFVTVDVTRTMKLVDELKRDADRYGLTGLRINPLLLVARALLVAIKRNPEVNAAWDEANQEIVRKHYVNLGIAAATPRGLLVPNIRDAHAKTLPELAASLADLVSTAREGKTSPAAMQDGTVTLTNVGVFGVDTGTPILNPGESAILAMGAIKLRPWVHKGKVKPRQVTTLALSFDHRLVDGELGSKVLADVAAVLEDPKRLIVWS